MPQNVQRAYELVRQQNEQKQTSENSLLHLCFHQVTLKSPATKTSVITLSFKKLPITFKKF